MSPWYVGASAYHMGIKSRLIDWLCLDCELQIPDFGLIPFFLHEVTRGLMTRPGSTVLLSRKMGQNRDTHLEGTLRSLHFTLSLFAQAVILCVAEIISEHQN